MKKVMFALLALLMLAAPAYAGFDWEEIDDYREIVMVDAPMLVEIAPDWYAGASVAKDINGTGSNDGWAVLGKISWMGSLYKSPWARPEKAA